MFRILENYSFDTSSITEGMLRSKERDYPAIRTEKYEFRLYGFPDDVHVVETQAEAILGKYGNGFCDLDEGRAAHFDFKGKVFFVRKDDEGSIDLSPLLFFRIEQ